MKSAMIAAVLFLSVLPSFDVLAMSSRVEKSDLIGKPAPEFRLPLLRGGEASLAQLSFGRKTIVFFWATWCPHCRQEIKRLKEMLQDLEARNVKVILVNVGEDAAAVQKYIDKNDIPLDIMLDAHDSLSASYQLVGIPTFIFIDIAGTVKNTTHALADDFEDMFE